MTKAHKIDPYAKYTGSTETHRAVDEHMFPKDARELQSAYEEGFAASSGIRPETAESGGRIKHPETQDHQKHPGAPDLIEEENAGLADS